MSSQNTKRKGRESVSKNSAGPKRSLTVAERLLKPEVRQTRGVGIVLTCGQGETGQLGLGPDITDRKKPSLIPNLTNVIDVCAGGMHSMCLTSSGEVYSWGCNDDEALGRNTSEEGTETVPGKVDIDEKVVQISAGDSHSAALTESGKVFIWGSFRDSYGNMGLTLRGSESRAVPLTGNISRISSGDDHLVLLTNTGKLLTCGCAERGQLGRIPQRSMDRKSRHGLEKLLNPGEVSVHVRVRYEFDEIWTGSYSTFARERIAGDIYAFGLNNHHQLGLNNVAHETCNRPIVSTSFPREKKWQMISGGDHHTVCLDGEGVTYSLGRKEYGRLGLGEDCEDASVPTIIPSLRDKNVVSIACGGSVSFAVTSTGVAYGWGMGTNNQIGLGTEDDAFEPVLITGKQLENRSVVKIASGGQHTIFLVVDS